MPQGVATVDLSRIEPFKICSIASFSITKLFLSLLLISTLATAAFAEAADIQTIAADDPSADQDVHASSPAPSRTEGQPSEVTHDAQDKAGEWETVFNAYSEKLDQYDLWVNTCGYLNSDLGDAKAACDRIVKGLGEEIAKLWIRLQTLEPTPPGMAD
jgi:predicted lipid-binding transport protein (Tim44 family)